MKGVNYKRWQIQNERRPKQDVIKGALIGK